MLSSGRLDIGLGLGWSAAEYDAVGVPQRRLAARQEELLDVFDALWGSGPVGYAGSDFSVAPTAIRPTPVQSPRPPVLLAALTPSGLERVGGGPTLDASGTVSVRNGVDAVGRQGRSSASGARSVGTVTRGASQHQCTLRRLGADRPTYHGSIEQIAADVRGAFGVGAHQVILELQGTASDVSEYFDLADAIVEAADLRTAA